MTDYPIYPNILSMGKPVEPWGIGRTGLFLISEKTTLEKSVGLPLLVAVIGASNLPIAQLPTPVRDVLTRDKANTSTNLIELSKPKGNGCDRTKWPDQGFRGISGTIKELAAPPPEQ
jgi:hypothetical protein